MTQERPVNVLFLCTGNSARSILAQALLRHRSGRAGLFHAFSAGSRPTGRIHPLALGVLEESGVAARGLSSKSWDVYARSPVMDVVITVCDNAANESCPLWPGTPLRAHWGWSDPAAVEGDEARRREAFRALAKEIEKKIDAFLALPWESWRKGDLSASEMAKRLGKI